VNLINELVLFIDRNIAEAVNIVVGMELGEVYLLNVVFFDLHASHLFVHFVALDEGISHFYSEGFHRVRGRHLEHCEVFVEVVAHLALASGIASSKHV